VLTRCMVSLLPSPSRRPAHTSALDFGRWNKKFAYNVGQCFQHCSFSFIFEPFSWNLSWSQDHWNHLQL
jgi:hypothetical protein